MIGSTKNPALGLGGGSVLGKPERRGHPPQLRAWTDV